MTLALMMILFAFKRALLTEFDIVIHSLLYTFCIGIGLISYIFLLPSNETPLDIKKE